METIEELIFGLKQIQNFKSRHFHHFIRLIRLKKIGLSLDRSGLAIQIDWGESKKHSWIEETIEKYSSELIKWLGRRKFCQDCNGDVMVAQGDGYFDYCSTCYGYTISEMKNFWDLQKMGVPIHEILGYGSEEERIEANKTMLPLIKLLVQKRISKEQVLAELRRLQEKYPQTSYLRDWAPF